MTIRRSEVIERRESSRVRSAAGQLLEAFERRAEAVTFPRPVVERLGDRIALLLSDAPHRRPLPQVLANPTVRILVRSALPRVIRPGEVDRHSRRPLDLSESIELTPVVRRDRLEQIAMLLDQLDQSCVQTRHVPPRELADQGHAAGTLDQADDAVLIARSEAVEL